MKILIADDERYIRNGIANSIEWGELGISEVLLAEDGLQALEICRIERPCLLITDIRMPGMTGLELASAAVHQYQVQKVIILSGYSEFTYAKEAVRLGVEEYLVKPVDLEQLTGLIRKCVFEISGSLEITF